MPVNPHFSQNGTVKCSATNKARYHELVVEPALLFIYNFAPHPYQLSPFFLADARPTRGALFRIYRDIRFAANNRTFKTFIFITPAARMRAVGEAGLDTLSFMPASRKCSRSPCRAWAVMAMMGIQ